MTSAPQSTDSHLEILRRNLHQLNNTLGPMLMLPDLIRQAVPAESAAHQDLATIQTSARTACSIIGQMREQLDEMAQDRP